jgi:hypothetical protein
MSYFKYFQKVDYNLRDSDYTTSLTNLTHFSKITSRYLDDISLYSFVYIEDGERPDSLSQRLYGTTEYYWTFFLVNQHLVNTFNDWPKNQYELVEYTEAKYPNLAAIAGQINSSEFDTIAGKFNIGETVEGQLSGATGTVIRKYPTAGYVEIKPLTGTFNPDGEGILGRTTSDFLSAGSIVKRAYAPQYWVNGNGDRILRNTGSSTSYTNFQYEYDKNLSNAKIRSIKAEYIADVARAFSKEMKNKSS